MKIFVKPYTKCTDDIEPSICQCDSSFSFRRKKSESRIIIGVKVQARFIPLHSSSFFALPVLIPLAQGQTNGFVFKLHFRVSEHWLPAVERVNFVLQESICTARVCIVIRRVQCYLRDIDSLGEIISSPPYSSFSWNKVTSIQRSI